MTSIRRFSALDLFKFNAVNLDVFTETYNIPFYFSYLATWPDLFNVAESAGGKVMGYVMGKVEGKGKDWHGHVSALTVGPEFRRLGLGKVLMHFLEEASEKIHNCYFVDLFVRPSNTVAIKMYNKLDYIVYRRVINYYYSSDKRTPSEDAYDMRKSLARDPEKKSMIPLGYPVYPSDTDF